MSEITPLKTKLAILGWGQGRAAAPYNDPSFDIWGINPKQHIPEVSTYPHDMWFCLHREYEDPQFCNWLEALATPVIMWEAPYTWSSVYPLDLVLKTIPRSLLSSTGAEALALALCGCPHYKEIHLYGFVCQWGTEYAGQRPGLESLVMLGCGLQKQMHVHPPTYLFTSRNGNKIYGLDEDYSFDETATLASKGAIIRGLQNASSELQLLDLLLRNSGDDELVEHTAQALIRIRKPKEETKSA